MEKSTEGCRNQRSVYKECNSSLTLFRMILSILFRLVMMVTGYSIPQGWCVLTSFISVHMDEDNYENPYKFNPWRWEVSIN